MYSIIRRKRAAATQEINCQDSFKAMHSLARRLSIHERVEWEEIQQVIIQRIGDTKRMVKVRR